MSDYFDCRKDTAVILPSLDPDKKIKTVIDGLISAGFEHIVLINDGSSKEHLEWFDYAAGFEQCVVLTHEQNRGKGRALKTGFEYVMSQFPALNGVVTIDGDGQHLTEDIIACTQRMLEEKDKLILGCRDFDQPGVPSRSVAGNKMTSSLFRLCYGIKLSDTQTGLRAIPSTLLPACCAIEGERFEYETNMLLNMNRMGVDLVEQPITTVYDPDDYSSHYSPIKDSLRILKVMFKFMLSSIGSTVVDLSVFYLILRLFASGLGNYAELVATIIARACSSFFNFSANNAVVFKNKKNYKRSLIRYYCLCIPQLLVSAGLVTVINHLLSNTMPFFATLIKFAVDTALFFISYSIQREWVFSQKN